MKRLFFVVFLATATFMGCGKDGATGPKGDNGAPGTPGEQGVKGIDGTVILSGMESPGMGIGKVGDYYIDLSKGNFYGPKTNTSWGEPLSLKGTNGTNGKDGVNGVDGKDGANGTNGKDGVNGVDGKDGANGTNGKDGVNGVDGKDGANGTNGKDGVNGVDGKDGANGTNGKDGSKIYSGYGTPLIWEGMIGDYFFNKSTLTFYGPKTSSGWGEGVVLGSTKNFGVQVFLINNVKFQIPTNTHVDYMNTKPWFYYKNDEVNMGQVNIKKGIYHVYWRYRSPNNDNNVNVNNYFDYQWIDVVSNGRSETINYGNNNTITFRVDPLRIGYNPLTRNYVLQWVLVGEARNGNGASSNPDEFYNFLQDSQFDILIKYIPEASVTQVQANGLRVEDVLSIQKK